MASGDGSISWVARSLERASINSAASSIEKARAVQSSFGFLYVSSLRSCLDNGQPYDHTQVNTDQLETALAYDWMQATITIKQVQCCDSAEVDSRGYCP